VVPLEVPDDPPLEVPLDPPQFSRAVSSTGEVGIVG
jgi:hypothetical protein